VSSLSASGRLQLHQLSHSGRMQIHNLARHSSHGLRTVATVVRTSTHLARTSRSLSIDGMSEDSLPMGTQSTRPVGTQRLATRRGSKIFASMARLAPSSRVAPNLHLAPCTVAASVTAEASHCRIAPPDTPRDPPLGDQASAPAAIHVGDTLPSNAATPEVLPVRSRVEVLMDEVAAPELLPQLGTVEGAADEAAADERTIKGLASPAADQHDAGTAEGLLERSGTEVQAEAPAPSMEGAVAANGGAVAEEMMVDALASTAAVQNDVFAGPAEVAFAADDSTVADKTMVDALASTAADKNEVFSGPAEWLPERSRVEAPIEAAQEPLPQLGAVDVAADDAAAADETMVEVLPPPAADQNDDDNQARFTEVLPVRSRMELVITPRAASTEVEEIAVEDDKSEAVDGASMPEEIANQPLSASERHQAALARQKEAASALKEAQLDLKLAETAEERAELRAKMAELYGSAEEATTAVAVEAAAAEVEEAAKSLNGPTNEIHLHSFLSGAPSEAPDAGASTSVDGVCDMQLGRDSSCLDLPTLESVPDGTSLECAAGPSAPTSRPSSTEPYVGKITFAGTEDTKLGASGSSTASLEGSYEGPSRPSASTQNRSKLKGKARAVVATTSLAANKSSKTSSKVSKPGTSAGARSGPPSGSNRAERAHRAW